MIYLLVIQVSTFVKYFLKIKKSEFDTKINSMLIHLQKLDKVGVIFCKTCKTFVIFIHS